MGLFDHLKGHHPKGEEEALAAAAEPDEAAADKPAEDPKAAQPSKDAEKK